MKIFISIFTVTITVFFFFSLSLAYSWLFYWSATIHKNYMFLFCNSLLVFIYLNSHSGYGCSTEKDYGQELAKKKQAAGYCESKPLDSSRTIGGDKKETGSLHVEQVREDWILIAEDNDEKAGETLSIVVEEIYDDKTLLVNVEETRDDELEVVEDDKTLSVLEETQDDELEAVEDDKTLSVAEQTQDDESQAVEDDKTLSVVEETQDDELDAVEDDRTLSKTEGDELEAVEVEDDKTLSVLEETQDDNEQEQGGSIGTISLEELNKKCEEFIRKMKEDIRVQFLTIQCQ